MWAIKMFQVRAARAMWLTNDVWLWIQTVPGHQRVDSHGGYYPRWGFPFCPAWTSWTQRSWRWLGHGWSKTRRWTSEIQDIQCWKLKKSTIRHHYFQTNTGRSWNCVSPVIEIIWNNTSCLRGGQAQACPQTRVLGTLIMTQNSYLLWIVLGHILLNITYPLVN